MYLDLYRTICGYCPLELRKLSRMHLVDGLRYITDPDDLNRNCHETLPT